MTPAQPDSPVLRRSSGVLLHVTSLPSKYGIGDVGSDARQWIDTLQLAKQTWWQILPLNPPDPSHSPYSALSAFAGNAALISPDVLVEEGFLDRADVPATNFPSGRVHFASVLPFKQSLLEKAWLKFRANRRPPIDRSFKQFCATQAAWLDDFALFLAMKERYKGLSWREWDRPIKLRRPDALRTAREALADAIDRHRFVQFLFDRQWQALRAYARERDIRLIGDMPIYVSGESADVWANPHLFQLDRNLNPKSVAGVPPDAFAVTGQRWGMPLFDWGMMKKDGFAWWSARLAACLRQTDLVRIDHFRGLAGYWSIPAHEKTAEHGKWVRGPGAPLLEAMKKACGGLPVIAEDLGVITPDVIALRDQFDLPGMKILQNAFGGDDSGDLPHNHPANTIVYSGTHDNDTTIGWFRSIPPAERLRLAAYAPGTKNDPAGTLMRLALSSVARLAILPLQDVLRLGSEARMNRPGMSSGDWVWRFAARSLKQSRMAELAEMTQIYGRAAHLRRPADSELTES